MFCEGRPGSSGKDGLPGMKGDSGRNGRPGDPGARGLTGLRGDKGGPGRPGSDGLPGDRGLTGARGDKGIILTELKQHYIMTGERPNNSTLVYDWLKQCAVKLFHFSQGIKLISQHLSCTINGEADSQTNNGSDDKVWMSLSE